MNTFVRWLSGALAGLCAYAVYLLGGWDAALKIMFTVMALDYITGVICALLGKSGKTKNGGFRSSVAFLGLTRKLLMLLIVVLAAALDRMLGTDNVCRLAVIGFYVSSDGMSVIENAALLGVPFPQKLLDTLELLKEKSGEKKEE